jgi:hypothetical protein
MYFSPAIIYYERERASVSGRGGRRKSLAHMKSRGGKAAFSAKDKGALFYRATNNQINLVLRGQVFSDDNLQMLGDRDKLEKLEMSSDEG